MTFVYFAQQEKSKKLVKIGMTDHLEERIYTLQCEQRNPLRLLGATQFETRKVAALVERGLHLHFDEHCHHGEWFHACDELLSLPGTPLIRFGVVKPPRTVSIILRIPPAKRKALKLMAIEKEVTVTQLLESWIDRCLRR